MKKLMMFGFAVLLCLPLLQAQKFFTREAQISFFSDTPIEKIEAHNKAGTSVIDAESGRVEFAVLIKAFQFEKALMQEHFNENYMESTKFPKGTFKGAITDLSAVDFGKDGTYPVKVKGEMTIHGVTNDLESEGEIVIKNGLPTAHATFDIAVADYDIKIPAVVRDNIAKTVRIDMQATYQALNK